MDGIDRVETEHAIRGIAAMAAAMFKQLIEDDVPEHVAADITSAWITEIARTTHS
jgi:hypothetical protein